MRTDIIYLIILYTLFSMICTGCSDSITDSGKDSDTNTESKMELANLYNDDSVTDEDDSSVWRIYLDRFSGTDDNNLSNTCVCYSKISSKEHPDMLMVDNNYTYNEYIKPNSICANFSIITYKKHEDIKRQYDVVYEEPRFITPNDKAKGYAVCGMSDGNLVLIKCMESGNSYHVIKKEDESSRLNSGSLVTSENDEYTKDGEKISKSEAEELINDILDNISVVLIKDGELDDLISSCVEKLQDCSLSYKEAKTKAFSLAYKEVNAKDVFKKCSGKYTTNSGDESCWTDMELKDDGTFTGGYYNLNTGSDKGEYASFSGTFSIVRESNKESYYLECSDFKYNDNKVPDKEKYIYKEPYKKDEFSLFKLYDKGLDFYSFDIEAARLMPEYFEHEVFDWFNINAYYNNTTTPDKTDRYILESQKSGLRLYGDK